jgi:hypothetical protein
MSLSVVVAALAVFSADSAVAAAATWTPEQVAADGTGLVLNAVKCKSRSMCVAVGSNGAGLAAERWNGTAWSVMRPVTLKAHRAGASFAAVACSDVRHCTAVGHDGCSGPVVERWNGARWALERIPMPRHLPRCGLRTGLAGVSCTSARYCLAVGGTDAYTWNGKRWRSIRGVSGTFVAVSCEGPNRCAAVGDWANGSLLGWWNGRRWSLIRNFEDTDRFTVGLDGVSCSPDRYCTAVSGYFNDYPFSFPDFNEQTWNGGELTWVLGFNGISCTAKNACVSSAETFDSLGEPLGPVAMVWDGRSWLVDSALLPTPGVSSISCVTAAECTMVGSGLNFGPVPFAVRNY